MLGLISTRTGHRVFGCALFACAATSCQRPVGLERAPAYERGLHLFPSPRRFDGPGTVYRIGPDGVRRAVVDLSSLVVVTPRQEAVPTLRVRGAFNLGAFVDWLGHSRGLGLQRIDSATITVVGGMREQAFESDLRRVVDSAVKLVDWTKSGRVFVITETVLADSVDISLSASRAYAFGDSLSSDSARARGIAVRWMPGSSLSIALGFPAPHRVFYKAEQIIRVTRFEGDSLARFTRIPVEEPHIWEPSTDTVSIGGGHSFHLSTGRRLGRLEVRSRVLPRPTL